MSMELNRKCVAALMLLADDRYVFTITSILGIIGSVFHELGHCISIGIDSSEDVSAALKEMDTHDKHHNEMVARAVQTICLREHKLNHDYEYLFGGSEFELYTMEPLEARQEHESLLLDGAVKEYAFEAMRFVNDMKPASFQNTAAVSLSARSIWDSRKEKSLTFEDQMTYGAMVNGQWVAIQSGTGTLIVGDFVNPCKIEIVSTDKLRSYISFGYGVAAATKLIPYDA